MNNRKTIFQNAATIKNSITNLRNDIKVEIPQQTKEIPTSLDKKIVIVGAGVAGINAATKLVDNGYDGSLITIIDKGNDPINRLPEEVMTGMLGAGGWSDGKLTYHTAIGGQLSKYCGEEKAMELMKQVVDNFTRFHPKPEEIFMSDPQEKPEFIKPYFGLRMFPVWHIGSNFLHEIAKTWYQYLVDKGVNFNWNTTVTDINFNDAFFEELKTDPAERNKFISSKTDQRSHFKKTMTVENNFNRCVMFAPDVWHAADGYFGDTLDNSRLTITFFGIST